ncbi:SPX and EXS domain-containing protein 3 [Mycena sanguinolenta]|uniref:SPX and EXS domain-containing protein 3 n=1 Tax=Mycena sanguinolenta TaxID=230812 RepID=A0A8H6Y239_9AGAR|nr:SPX and EXS domain-containing protein 3 [Mycena sanguinolenta]
MKFAQYLEDTQTPEWRRKYINYKLLKKRISAIRQTYATQNAAQSPTATQVNPEPAVTSEASNMHATSAPNLLHPTISVESTKSSPSHHSEPVDTPSSNNGLGVPTEQRHQRPLSYRSQTAPAPIDSRQRPSRGRVPSFSHLFSSSSSRRFTKLAGPKLHPFSELPLHELMRLLSPPELAFFSTLDAEIEKIEAFYVAKEQEMKNHTELLALQLHELDEHRKLFDAAYPSGTSAMDPLILKFKSKLVKDEEAVLATAKDKGKATINKTVDKLLDNATSSNVQLFQEGNSNLAVQPRLDPEEYQSARRKLKKAVLEHYRGLETLYNYRILNLTGIRKALKKFQKVTKIAAQDAYTTEKVDKTAFASEVGVRSMMDEMEEMYITRFAHGDKKEGLNHASLWSTFVTGLYKSFQPSVRDSIPGWDGLLFVYGVFLIPVVFSVLLGLNITAWSRARINYVFIFEFDLLTRLDHREYFTIPTLLLATLCYSFWLSFAQIGAPTVSPTIWPAVWLGFTTIIMLDPFPILFKSSRYWLLRNVAKLLASGTRRVEFSDFWLGDQFCSLVFTLSNLNLVDFLVDWSILRVDVPHPLLRKDLVYSNHIYLYYFAILSNILIRFIWGSLKMTRRFQWNFFRVESEHIGNVDQYRVTREVPLPYSLDGPRGYDADDDEEGSPSRTWIPQRAIRLRQKRAVPEV